jgi:transcriptional regulator GlxA family with amidase domain
MVRTPAAPGRELIQVNATSICRCSFFSEAQESVKMRKRTGAGPRHYEIVARFEEFLEANPDRPLYLAEICPAIGVGERTLRVACEKYLGMGPIRYLSSRRMHLARRALLRADPTTATVTRIATDHGFWEFGRFSVTYRSVFGETPSETLRRSDRPRLPNRVSVLEILALHG